MRKINISEPVMGDEEWQALKEPLQTGWLTSGPKVRQFEEFFAEMHDVKHAIAVTSATTALHLAVLALNVKPGDEVIVPAFTWISTANAVEYCGAKPVFVDIDLNTFNLDVSQLRQRITPKTKAIIAVSLFGLSADIPAIRQAAPGIPIIEDAACAAGAEHRDGKAGSLAEIGCFSFHPRKSVTTGEGGMVTTQDDAIADLVQKLRNHGASISEEQRHHGPQPYILPEFDLLGYNYRMTDLQGAVGYVQLQKLNRFIDERKQWASFYSEKLSGLSWLKTPETPAGYRHGWQSYVTLIDEAKSPKTRNEIMKILQDKGIATRPGTHAVHMLGYYANKYSLRKEDFPNALRANDKSMAIPLHNKMTVADFEYVVDALKTIDQ